MTLADGFALDIEGQIYTVLQSNEQARAAWTEFLVTLKARMDQAVPGSHLSVWCATTGGESDHSLALSSLSRG